LPCRRPPELPKGPSGWRPNSRCFRCLWLRLCQKPAEPVHMSRTARADRESRFRMIPFSLGPKPCSMCMHIGPCVAPAEPPTEPQATEALHSAHRERGTTHTEPMRDSVVCETQPRQSPCRGPGSSGPAQRADSTREDSVICGAQTLQSACRGTAKHVPH
jgi:hypothetical protein